VDYTSALDCRCRLGTWRELCDTDASQEAPAACCQYGERPGSGNNERPRPHPRTVAGPHPLAVAEPHALNTAGPHAPKVAGSHALIVAEPHTLIVVRCSLTER
jgi:hypothetical protein